MKRMYGVALGIGLMLAGVSPVAADVAAGPDEDAMEVYVVNNHLVAVRVFAEDAKGKLHSLGRVARGRLKSFAVPAEMVGGSFRIKVYPANPVWEPTTSDYGVKTNPLDPASDLPVTVWLEADLASSIVQIGAS